MRNKKHSLNAAPALSEARLDSVSLMPQPSLPSIMATITMGLAG